MSRNELAVTLLRGNCDGLRELAERCSWQIPPTLSVAATAAGMQRATAALSDPRVLNARSGERLLLVAAPEVLGARVQQIATPASPVAISLPVPPERVYRAAPLALHTLELAASDTIALPASGVVAYAEHRTPLLLHSDHALRQMVVDELLAPLAVLSPRRRLTLAETMLMWLQSHENACQLANRLQIRAATVRRRQDQLNLLFADVLNDPNNTGALIVALTAALPRWRREARRRYRGRPGG